MCWTVVRHEQKSVELLVSLFGEWRLAPKIGDSGVSERGANNDKPNPKHLPDFDRRGSGVPYLQGMGDPPPPKIIGTSQVSKIQTTRTIPTMIHIRRCANAGSRFFLGFFGLGSS